MIELSEVKHHIQKYILSVLMHAKYARFRDLRPPRVDTNLYSYHLKVLLKSGMITKTEYGYTLGARGLDYVDRVNADKLFVRNQPKIITMLVVQNSDGDVLLQKHIKQPYIDTWTLPYGKLHIDDESVESAGSREASEKLGISHRLVTHAGDCYIRIRESGKVVSSTLAHICRLESDDIVLNEHLVWARPHKLSQYDLAPAVEQIVARTFFRDPYFFEEFTSNIDIL